MQKKYPHLFTNSAPAAEVMAISVISISSDSSEDSVGTPAGRVILFESDPAEDPSSDHITPLPAISPFLSSDDDPTDSDTPDTPSSPTYGTPFTEIIASTQRSPIIPHRRVMLLAPGQPIPHGRLYRYHLNGPVHMMIARKWVGPLPTHHLAERHSADHSSSDSSPKASSDFHSDALSDPSLRHPLPDHSSSDLPGTSAGPSRKRRRSPMTSVPALSPVSSSENSITASTQRSPIIPRRRVMLLAPGQPIPHGRPYRYHLNGPVHMMTARKRVRPLPTHHLAVRHYTDHSSSDSSPEASSDFHFDILHLIFYETPIVKSFFTRFTGTSAGPSRKRRRSPMTSVPALSPSRVIPEIQAEMTECLLTHMLLGIADIDARVVVEAIDREEIKTGVRGPVEGQSCRGITLLFHDHTHAIPVHRIQTIEGVQREKGHRMVGVESAVIALTERIAKLERDNRRLRGTMSVESQRVDRL
ncbi:hypothetical protein Tco_0040140 [Tanacetum coccineum]